MILKELAFIFANKTATRAALVSALIAIVLAGIPPHATAANPTSTPSKEHLAQVKELKALEHRYFFHAYDHDPLEKRVERLELLIFGSAQYGVFEERLARVQQAIKSRDEKAARELRERNQTGKSSAGDDQTKTSSSTDYPMVTTLEWRILKKTYRKQSLDQRLERLETKLFGQPSTAMSYADRIERLKKVAGIGVPRAQRPGASGPMPRAYQKRRSMTVPQNPFNNRSFEDDYRRQMNRDMRYMYKYMNKDMRDMLKNFGFGASPFSRPGKGPFSSPYVAPKKQPSLPPYADPNSI